MIRATATGVEIEIHVITRAQTSQFAGERGGVLLVRLAAPPVDGAANDALLQLLSERLSRPRRAIRLIKGERSRSKRVAIDGISAADAQQLFLGRDERQGRGRDGVD